MQANDRLFTKIFLALILLSVAMTACSGESSQNSADDGGFGSPGPSDRWTPAHQYVAITFDDGVRGQDMQQSLIDLQSNEDGSGIQKNSDGSLVRFTYFVTTQGTEWSSAELWHALGNEVANHTVTHGMNSEGFLGNHTREQWLQELTDLERMMSLYILSPDENEETETWIDIKVIGFRCPFLDCNSSTFEALVGPGGYFTEKNEGFSSITSFYESSIVFTVPNESFDQYPHPVKLLDCSSIYGIAAETDCPQWIDPDKLDAATAAKTWEIPFPNFYNPDEGSGGDLDCAFRAMVLPVCPTTPADQVAEKLQSNLDANLALARNNNNAPFVISLHTGEFALDRQKLLGLKNFILAHSGPNGDVVFVTMSEIADMYETGNEIVGTIPPREPASRCDIDNVALQPPLPIWLETDGYMGTESKTLCPFPIAVRETTKANPPLPSVSCESTVNAACSCNYFCQDAQGGDWTGGYGADCGIKATLNTNTCNTTCGGAIGRGTFTEGASPWLGNPGGNLTPGEVCDTFPQNASS